MSPPDHDAQTCGVSADLWEWCPDCQSYFHGAHLCRPQQELALQRVEAKLDQILRLLQHPAQISLRPANPPENPHDPVGHTHP